MTGFLRMCLGLVLCCGMPSWASPSKAADENDVLVNAKLNPDILAWHRFFGQAIKPVHVLRGARGGHSVSFLMLQMDLEYRCKQYHLFPKLNKGTSFVNLSFQTFGSTLEMTALSEEKKVFLPQTDLDDELVSVDSTNVEFEALRVDDNGDLYIEKFVSEDNWPAYVKEKFVPLKHLTRKNRNEYLEAKLLATASRDLDKQEVPDLKVGLFNQDFYVVGYLYCSLEETIRELSVDDMLQVRESIKRSRDKRNSIKEAADLNKGFQDLNNQIDRFQENLRSNDHHLSEQLDSVADTLGNIHRRLDDATESLEKATKDTNDSK